MDLVPAKEEHWSFIRDLRMHPDNISGFLTEANITDEQQKQYMQKYGDCYFVALSYGKPVGYVGVIDGDIRICTDPSNKRSGVGKFMLRRIFEMFPKSKGRILKDNLASQRLFSKCKVPFEIIMKIGILTDTRQSWILPYIEDLKKGLANHEVYHVFSSDEVEEGDVLFALSCEKILRDSILKKNDHNIVVHPSALPKGRGWSPLAWQILEGQNRIPVSLFEAQASVDSGAVYLVDYLELDGTELNDEIKDLQGKKTVEMCLSFIKDYDTIEGKEQEGEPTFYTKRTAESSQLDVSKSIKDQFNLLRVVDNKRYPAHFFMKGHKYTITIEREQ